MTTQEWIDKESKTFDDLNKNYLDAKKTHDNNQKYLDSAASIASGAGAAIGTGIGMFGGPLGMMAGGTVGAALGPMVAGIGSLFTKGDKTEMDNAFNDAQRQLLQTEKANAIGREVNQIKSYSPGAYGDSFVKTQDKTLLT